MSLQPHNPTSPWHTYRIRRGEQGVLTYEPYKSALLPLWRFRTPAIARTSSTALWDRFLAYEEAGDFVGMDMCRKFLQMGMTRSMRYANHRGGRKYGVVKKQEGGREEEEEEEEGGRKEKEEASLIFREVWERVKGREGYGRAKEEFLGRQRRWDGEVKRGRRRRGGEMVVVDKEEEGCEGGDETEGDGHREGERKSRKRKRR